MNVDSFMPHKADTSSTVVGIMKGSVLGLANDFWVKRFNAKGIGDFLFQQAFGSKAKRVWDISWKLYEKGLPVAKPLAYYPPSLGLRHSFFLCTVIENSDNLGNIIKSGNFGDFGHLLQALAKTVAKWHSAGVVHGDMKWPNVVVRQEDDVYEFFLVDLDQARLHDKPRIRGIEKDLSRFYRDGLELDAEDWVVSSFLPAYFDAMPRAIKTKIDMDSARNRAYREWERRGKRTFPTFMNKDTNSQGC